ncbi:MAG: hypothetical protein LC108_15380 [Anaerolineales bacterium]|nr:hypothetical protein [Anaerolineales bacterium]
MLKKFNSEIVLGILLLLGGALALLQALGYLKNASGLFWGGVFIAAGLLCLSLLLGGHWWGAFPGLALIAIGVTIFLPDNLENFGGLIFFGGIAVAFWIVYLLSPQERWWALIPAGVLTTLGGMTVVSERFGEFQSAGFFLLGLSVTFLLVALLAGMRWAYWPALGLGILAVLGIASLFEIANYLWAFALILAGTFLLVRYFRN